MNTVIVTRLASEPPARRNVWSISANTRYVCASKSPEMSLPSPSTVAVCPASQTMRPPSVTTAGEYARLFCASVPSKYLAMEAPFVRPRVAQPRRAYQYLIDSPPSIPRTKESHMDLGLKGQAALVTGGSKGIGKAVARGLAQEGVRVAICARDKASLDAAAQELTKATSAEGFQLAGELTRPDDVQRIVDATPSRFGPPD